MTDIQGRCPACRGASLFLGSGGYVTCARLDCPNPSAADQLLHGEQTTGYCPACGRGDVAPAADEYEKQRQRAERAEAVVTQVRQLLATGQIGCCAHLVRTALDQPTPAPAAAPALWLLAGTRDLNIPTQHAFTARPVDPETERAATERAIQAAADSEKSAAWFAAHSQPAPTPAPAATEATEQEKTLRVFAALHRSAEQDVSRVIALYEQWVKAGPPLGTSMTGYFQWWREHLAELHDAILPPVREQKDRPTHPDGTPYRYAEIVAEGWGYCDGCRTWSTATPERPHLCTNNRVQAADQTKEQRS